MSKKNPKILKKAILDMADAAREIKRVCDAQSAYTRQLQELAAEARRTGESQTHRIPVRHPKVFNIEDGVMALLDALARYERHKED